MVLISLSCFRADGKWISVGLSALFGFRWCYLVFWSYLVFGGAMRFFVESLCFSASAKVWWSPETNLFKTKGKL